MNRRKLLTGGLAAAAGATGIAVAGKLAKQYGLVPTDAVGFYGPGEAVTYAAQRIITNHSLAREFPESQISNPPFVNGAPPKLDAYRKLQSENFANWKLSVDGLVARPMTFSMADLKAQPSRSHITHLACEEGWSYIAKWTGVPLSHILEISGILPQARYVIYYSIDPEWWDSIDMADALHPQTLVAYGMNNGEIPPGNGGPLRVRVPRQLGYKSVKYITRLTITDDVKKFGKGFGSASEDGAYAWYAGI